MDLLIFLIGIVIGGILSFLHSYFSEKGKNLATKEDVSNLTKKVETIRTNFWKEQQDFLWAREDLLTKINIYRELLELTSKFYEEVINQQVYITRGYFVQSLRKIELPQVFQEDKERLLSDEDRILSKASESSLCLVESISHLTGYYGLLKIHFHDDVAESLRNLYTKGKLIMFNFPYSLDEYASIITEQSKTAHNLSELDEEVYKKWGEKNNPGELEPFLFDFHEKLEHRMQEFLSKTKT